MRFSTVVIALAGASTALASAIPGISTLQDRQAALCAGASNSPVCCATDVLGVADLDCAPRMFYPSITLRLDQKSNLIVSSTNNSNRPR